MKEPEIDIDPAKSKAWKIACEIIYGDGFDIRIRGQRGGSKLLSRFDGDTFPGIDHRLRNARMMLASWINVALESPAKAFADELSFDL